MQQRRMFSKEIVCSDMFLCLSNEAQVLYFHLVLNADNRGYVNNARSVISMFNGITIENLTELISAKFVLDRGNGLYLIKHWYIHNDIPTYIADETNYLEDLEKIYFDSNFAYTTRNTNRTVIEIIYKKPLKENKKKRNEIKINNEENIIDDNVKESTGDLLKEIEELEKHKK